MPSNVRACIYVLVAIFIGYMLCRILLKEQRLNIKKIAVAWAVISIVLFLSPSAPIYYIVTVAALLALAPKDDKSRLYLCLAIVPAVPLTAHWRVSLPGIETLIVLDYIKVLCLCLLLPIYLKSKAERPRLGVDKAAVSSRKLFLMLMAYLVITMLFDWRGVGVTEALRMVIERFLSLFLLLIVVVRVLKSRDSINNALFFIMIGGVMLAAVSCVEQYAKWKLYNEISPDLIQWSHFSMYVRSYRWGLMRTPVTMNPIPFGYFMCLCMMLSFYFVGLKKRGEFSYGGSHFITMLFAIGLVFSGSRGGWLTAGVMATLLVFFDARFKPFRMIVVMTGVLCLFSFSSILNYLVESDPYGSFQYRIDLFINSMAVMKDNTFFGSTDFINHPALQASRQGEGIIDIVNSYIRIGLQYGVPVLLLLGYLIFKLVSGLIAQRRDAEGSCDLTTEEWQTRMILSMIVGGVFIISTVSMVDRIPHYLFLTMVFGVAVIGIKPKHPGCSDKQP